VGADFVSLEDGTGLVHLAPAFGEDDQKVGKNEELPTLVTVDLEGKMITGFNFPGQGKFVKDADQDIKRDLAIRHLLFRSQKITHTYPFCWRCDTPLLYYPIKSWYVKVSEIRERLVKNNQKIHWVPGHIKNGRFGKWLEGARDWAVSRNRYWGAPIPVWQCQNCQKNLIIGSKEELGKYNLGQNNYYFLRHGESSCYLSGIIENDIKNDHCHLTKLGEKQIQNVAQDLKNKKIDLIISSDFQRTKQTAEIVAGVLQKPLIFEANLRDLDVGELNGKKVDAVEKELLWSKDNLNQPFPDGESRLDCWRRMKETFDKLESKYQGKNILIVSHAFSLECFYGIINGQGLDKIISRRKYFQIAELRNASARIWPFSQEGKIDFHRPYIDQVKLKCPTCGRKMNRIPEVFDCWFESGSMPYAQWHYPFENKKLVEETFPADFIAEGMDQTRGWFYTLHVLAGALTVKDVGLGKNQPAFKNVIANGLVLGEDGQKLSKHLKNYSPPEEVINKYGADALRFFLLSSTPIGQDYLFSEKRVADVYRRVVMTLWNSYLFFETYRPVVLNGEQINANNILDKWIISRLNSLIVETDEQIKKYELTKTVRPIVNFIDDLSNWYIRRSRKKFQAPESKEELEKSTQFLAFLLIKLSQIVAPSMPFIAENIYQRIIKIWPSEEWPESVHLSDFPIADTKKIDNDLEEKMEIVRDISRQILAERSRLGIKVRQPLAKVILKNDQLNNQDLWQLILEETNIKNIKINLESEDEISLDTSLTLELKQEGFLRDFIHRLQMMRKKIGLDPSQEIVLVVGGESELINWIKENQPLIKKEASINKIVFGNIQKTDLVKEIIFNEQKLKVGIQKSHD
ncbi:MAG TPA: isoleucine--tRNA ligase, partial [Candidatus Portnoybacteria bacterium]|nr:isoleucine--tRNA ligase [Candidatus Portnoybacteria bacterium]